MAGKSTVQIDTNQTGPGGYGSGSLPRVSKVIADDPWDPLSKIFKRYVHAIQFPLKGGQPNQFNVKVVSRGGSNNTFTLNSLDQWVEEVQVYFKCTASPSRDKPLIVGFIYDTSVRTGCDSNKCYYTWAHLTRRGYNVKTGTVGSDGVISENDLVIRLLEEIGASISRSNKPVIRLDEQPGDGLRGSQYPASGHFQSTNKQVTVKKVESGLRGFDKYEHSVSRLVSESNFYVSYDNNSRFLNTGSGSDKIEKVTAYYDTGKNEGGGRDGIRKLVLIVFSVTGTRGAYVYKYSDFVRELKKVNASNATDRNTVNTLSSSALARIGLLGSYQDTDLSTQLPQESKTLERLIKFETSGTGNEHIKTEGPQHVGKDTVSGKIKFRKYTMTPNTSDTKSGGGSSIGPWKVCNDKLIGHENSEKIQPGVLTNIITNGDNNKYKNITVYYAMTGSGNDHKALLVEFDPGGDGTKKYIKRTGKGGNQWADGNSDISGGKVDEGVLNKIGTAAGIIEGSNLAATVGGSIAGVGGVGAGVGYAIYKYPQVFLSLIGR